MHHSFNTPTIFIFLGLGLSFSMDAIGGSKWKVIRGDMEDIPHERWRESLHKEMGTTEVKRSSSQKCPIKSRGKGLPRFVRDQCPSYAVPLTLDDGVIAVMVL